MSFKAIKDQDKAIERLKRYISQDSLTGAYLFIGPEGVGKNLIAKTLAKAVNCEDLTLDSCDRCASCLKIEKNQHPDVHLIDASIDMDTSKSHIKIEDIRQLQKDINLKPYEGKKKVFIINDAHNLTPEAQNALLKTLEEPPQNSLIILVTLKPQLLFKTIISRCQTVKFYPLPRIELKEILRKDYGLDDTLAHFLAYFCEGRIGKALRLKDTDILKEKNRIIDTYVLSRDSTPDNFTLQSRKDVAQHLNTLSSWFRDIYLIKIGLPHYELINLDRKTQILKIMHRYSFASLDEIFNSISDSLLYLEQNINIKLLVSNLREDISYGARRAT